MIELYYIFSINIFLILRINIKLNTILRSTVQGTMEEKIYERQVTKQSLAQRVVDEHQIDRHFNQHDLAELYRFTPDVLDDPDRIIRPTPALPKVLKHCILYNFMLFNSYSILIQFISYKIWLNSNNLSYNV